MAVVLSATAQSLSRQIGIEPQIILEIDGIDAIFGAMPVLTIGRWDEDRLWDSDIRWDSPLADPNSKDYISLNKTSKSITQQLFPEKASAGSISTMNIELIDKNGEVSELFSFDNATDLLSKKAYVYLNFANGGSHPEDSIKIFNGFIDDMSYDSGTVLVSVSHPDNLKRQDIFNKVQAVLNGSIDSTQTVITVDSTLGILETRDAVTSYVRIEDEIMLVNSIDSDTQLTVARGQLTSFAASHDDESDVSTYYRMQGSATDLALKIMLSDEDNAFIVTDNEFRSINYESVPISYPNSFIFGEINIQDKLGLVVGDLIKCEGSAHAANNATHTILAFGVIDTGSYITVNSTLTTEADSPAVISYKSKYNTLADGLGMMPNEVDVTNHEFIKTTFGASIAEYEFFIKETINGKEFLDSQIYLPSSMYAIPRSARSSVKFVAPPLSIDDTPNLDITNIKNIETIKQRRSTHKYLYNSVTVVYNEDQVEEKFTRRKIVLDTDSTERIKSGKKNLAITAKGLRASTNTDQLINRLTRNTLNRYKFAATYVQGVQVLYKTGFNIEVGDVIGFGGADTKLTDLQTGTKNLPLGLYEIINKSLDVTTGQPKVDLLSTGFSVEARFAVFSPSSYINALTTTTSLITLKKSFVVAEQVFEIDKWRNYLGGKIRIYSEDYSRDETTTLVSFSLTLAETMIINPPLSFTPQENDIVEFPLYDDASDVVKLKFAFRSETKLVTVGTSNTIFDTDPTNLYVGQRIQLHSEDFSRDSAEVLILDITSNTITVDTDLGFTPQVNDLIEVLQYSSDEGNAYRFI